MFDFAWSEIMLIGIVALIAIGPKDLPVAMKAVTGMIKKARRMAAEFQTHVDDMMRDADLKEVRDQINELKRSPGGAAGLIRVPVAARRRPAASLPRHDRRAANLTQP